MCPPSPPLCSRRYMVVGIINPSGSEPASASTSLVSRAMGAFKALSPIRWAIESLCCAEFRGMQLHRGGWFSRVRDAPRMGALAAVRDGDEVLAALGLGGKEWSDGVWSLAKVSAVEAVVAVLALKYVTGTGARFK